MISSTKTRHANVSASLFDLVEIGKGDYTNIDCCVLIACYTQIVYT